jgi:hypothetical protein
MVIGEIWVFQSFLSSIILTLSIEIEEEKGAVPSYIHFKVKAEDDFFYIVTTKVQPLLIHEETSLSLE